MNFVRKPAATLLLTLAAATGGWGQPIPAELRTLVGQAVEHSPAVQRGILQEQASRLHTADAKSGYLPTVNATAGYQYYTLVSQAAFPGLGSFAFQPQNNYNAQLNVSQTLVDFGRTRTALETALEEEANARTTTESFRHLVGYQVAQVYYGVVFLQQSIAVQDTVLASLQENARTIEAKLRQGEAIDLDRLNTKSLIDQTQNRKIDLQNQLAKQMAVLQYLVGSAPSVSNRAQFDFQLADTTGLSSGKGNYSVRLAENQVKLAERMQATASRQYYPTLTAMASGGYRNGFLDPDHKPADALARFRPNAVVGASLTVPIYSGGRTDRAQQLARTQAALARTAQQDARDGYRRDLSSALADRDGAAFKLRNVASQVQQSQRALELAKSRYRNGVATNLDVLNSNDLYQQTRLAEVQARYQLTIAELEIARLSGVDLK